MGRVGKLAVALLSATAVGAQDLPTAPAELTAVKVSDQPETEVRIELSTSSAVSSPEVVATYRDSLVLELPGAVYRALPRRIGVGRAGIRAVRVWMQSEKPPSTHVVVEIDHTEQYTVSSAGNTVVLRVGPALQGVSATEIHSTSEGFGRHTPAVAARSASVAGALSGIFHRGPGKPAVYKGADIRNTGTSGTAASSVNDGATQAQGAAQASAEASSSTQDKPAAAAQSVSAAPDAALASSQTPAPLTTETSLPPAQRESSAPVPALPDARRVTAALSAEPAPPAAELSNTPGGVSTESKPDATPESKSGAAIESTLATTSGTASAPNVVKVVVPIANPGMRTEFHVKFVEEESAYIDGGRSAGLTEGMKLLVRAETSEAGTQSTSANGGVAELVVIGVAETSAVTEIHNPQRAVVPGDIAYLSSESVETLVQQHAMGATRSYPAVITFSEGGDALDEEAHAFVPRPPLPSVNRATGRIGFDYTGTKSTDASQLNSSSFGAIVRVDFTRMGGTYWDLRGYWRGRLISTSAASQQTLQDRLNRTYHLSLTYDNPNSRWVLGVGRMYLPWAVSLETLDGGYFGARLGHGTTLGVFGGSTPDPTSWNYNPDRHLGGTFFNATGGSFDSFHYSSTVGVGEDLENVQYTTTTSTGTSLATYQNNRPFAFIENSFSHKSSFSFFQALQADRPSSNPVVASPGAGISQSFTTLRIEPVSRVEFSANHTYFRDVPTFDPTLIGTGLLDKYLFQGFSGGVRIEPIKKIFLYADLGRSSRTGDAKAALNGLYGITFGELPKLRLRADAHYTRFTGSFGSGIYRAFSLSRSVGDRLHFEAIGGNQSFTTSLAGNQNARFFTANVDSSLGALLFVQSGFTMYRGQLQNYNETYAAIGYRFDTRKKRK